MIDASPLFRALAAGGNRGTKVADIVCNLVVHGGQPGELHSYQYRYGAQWKVGKVIPREWLKRLVTAIETGAIDKWPAPKIVEILLQGQPSKTV